MRFYLVLLFTILNSGCGGSSNSQSIVPDLPTATPAEPINAIDITPKSSEFMIETPEAVGFDAASLEASFTQASSQPSLRNMLVLKDNALVAEAYFNGHQAQDLQYLRSITKTITAMLVGIAIEQGVLSSTEQTIGEFFLEGYPDLSNQKADIQIQHLLTMTSGFEWDESGVTEFQNWNASSDPIGYVLQRDLVASPGSVFNYNSGAVHLLSAILHKALGSELEPFIMSHFFLPLGIEELDWERLGDNRFDGASGLKLKATDTLKIGLMLSNKGRFVNDTGEAKQIVPEQWIDQALTPRIAMNDQYGELQRTGYGYLWWFGQGNNTDIQLAWGWGGQFIMTAPDHNLVVVTNNDFNVGASQAQTQEQASLSLLFSGIMESLN